MAESSHTIRQEIHGVVLFVGAIWAVYFVSLVFPRLDYYGVVPAGSSGCRGSWPCRFCMRISITC